MKKRSMVIVVVLTLVGVVLSGCSMLAPEPTQTPMPTATPTPPPISDEDFADLAQDACAVLKADLDTVDAAQTAFYDKYGILSLPLKLTHDELADIEITQAAAPQATIFMNSLAEMAQVFGDFSAAFYVGLENAGLTLEDTSYAALSEDDRVLVFTDVWVDLELDPILVSKTGTVKDTFNAAAQALGLDACKLK
ncbi:MAG: hypothetical protein MUO40_08310 [Anaerolineaceae bacterium]|nr:hypothetical protein [Anaerolineaceae bacterium]